MTTGKEASVGVFLLIDGGERERGSGPSPARRRRSVNSSSVRQNHNAALGPLLHATDRGGGLGQVFEEWHEPEAVWAALFTAQPVKN
jgi:hypothetical protein